MANTCYHPSIEGAQHGAKTLAQFLDYAKKSGATGAQPSNYMLQSDKGFKSAKEIRDTFAKAKMSLDGVSAHYPFWVHTTAWTGSPSIRPFIPADVAKKSPNDIEKWAALGALLGFIGQYLPSVVGQLVDPLYTLHIVSAVAVFYGYLKDRSPGLLVLCGLLAGFSAWVKNEGILFTGVLTMVCE